METERYYFRVGIFCLLVVAALIYYLITFGGGQETKHLTRYAIYFDNSISGLSRGAPVKLKGISVGLVKQIGFVAKENDRILVLVDIADTAPIRKDTVASIEYQGITGATYLALENTQPNEPPIYLKKEIGEKYPVIQSAKSELQTVLSSAPGLMGGLAKTTEQMQKLLSDKNIIVVQGILAEAHDVLAEASGALREIKMLARTIREDPSVIIRGTTHEGYKVQK
ncbi:MAG: MCE family protein [Proteobacteria bacterium]|nr:MCE family protein [Pseudomonadota bacterium]